MFKWPFASRGATKKIKAAANDKVSGTLDFKLYAVNDSFIKVWLPERLIVALDKSSGTHNVSRPDAMRSLLFRHIYGLAAYEAFVVWKLNTTDKTETQSNQNEGIKFSQMRTVSIEFLGKSNENLKIWLPEALKNDLTLLAKQDGLGVSDYVRKVLVREFLGEQFYKDWRKHIGAIPAEVIHEESDLR